MATALTTVTNISSQTVPVLVNSITLDKANAASDIPAAVAQQTQIAPGAKLVVETQRLDVGQLEQLRNKGLVTFTG